MEILKKGDVERKWKFTCEICGCVFVLDVNDMAFPTSYYECPACGKLIEKYKGEKYEQSQNSFKDIYNKVCEEYPGFAKRIVDWQPCGPHELQFVLDNEEIWRYDEIAGSLYQGLKGE